MLKIPPNNQDINFGLSNLFHDAGVPAMLYFHYSIASSMLRFGHARGM